MGKTAEEDIEERDREGVKEDRGKEIMARENGRCGQNDETKRTGGQGGSGSGTEWSNPVGGSPCGCAGATRSMSLVSFPVFDLPASQAAGPCLRSQLWASLRPSADWAAACASTTRSR